MKLITKGLLVGVLNFMILSTSNAQDGKALFKAKCAACHSIGSQRIVGPGLEGINEKRSQEWLISWITDSQALINSGDKDAIAIFEEYGNMPMSSFDLPDAEIIAMLDYLKGEGAPAEATTEEAVTEEVVVVEYNEKDVETGRLLFSGKKRFENGGPSCITCHNVTSDDLISGGLLAKDLTNVFERIGAAGITGMVSAPPFPAMANSYNNKIITEQEASQLAAFFKHVNEAGLVETQDNGYNLSLDKGAPLFIGGGLVGLIIIFLLTSLIWSKRKKESTKKDIFSRQLKGNDSVES